MDEVDGMSAGDRGGVGALNVLIKKTRVSLCSSSEKNIERIEGMLGIAADESDTNHSGM